MISILFQNTPQDASHLCFPGEAPDRQNSLGTGIQLPDRDWVQHTHRLQGIQCKSHDPTGKFMVK